MAKEKPQRARPMLAATASAAPQPTLRHWPAGFIWWRRRSAICGDITLRALETLAGADLIACEDTRVTRRLTEHYGIATPLTPYHEHNAAEARPKLLARLAAGQAVALVSDAGTPLDLRSRLQAGARSDRGRPRRQRAAGRLRGADRARGRRPADRPFLFRGLPAAKAGGAAEARSPNSPAFRRRWCCSRAARGSAATLADLAARSRAACRPPVCRELTKLHEEVRRGELAATGARLCRQAPRRAAKSSSWWRRPPTRRRTLPRSTSCCAGRLQRVSVKDAVGEVALATGRPRREVYQRALTLSEGCRRCRAMNAVGSGLPKAAPVAKAAPRPERQVAFQLGISAESRAAAC